MKLTFKKEKLNEIAEIHKIPSFFIKTYKRFIFWHIFILVVLIAVAASFALFASKYSERSPVITGAVCFLLIFGAGSYKFGLKEVVFGKTWTGTICDIVYEPGARRTSIFDDLYFRDMMVKLFVVPTYGKSDEPVVIELGNYCKDATDSRQLRALGLNESHEDSFEKNPFYTKMPYQIGDKLIFLRGLRYPMRMEPEDYELQNVVCPYCGDCFSIRTTICPRCKRKMIYGASAKE